MAVRTTVDVYVPAGVVPPIPTWYPTFVVCEETALVARAISALVVVKAAYLLVEPVLNLSHVHDNVVLSVV